MTQRGRTVTAVLLTIVLLAALGILSTTIPASAALPEPIDVTLDFDRFLPGEAQTKTYPLNVPSAARFAEAGIVYSTGIANDVEWTFELCDAVESACRPVIEQADVAAGMYTLRVSALLSTNVAGEGSVLGRVRLEQADGSAGGSFTPFHWMIVAAMAAVVVGGIAAVVSAQRTARRARREPPRRPTDRSESHNSEPARSPS